MAKALPGSGSRRSAPLVGLLVLLAALATDAAYGQDDAGRTIVLAADAWPPYNCADGDTNRGYMIDIARTVFGAEGYEVEYDIVPWRRALAGARDGRYDGAVGATKLEGVGLVFPDEELLRGRVAFYVRRESTWDFVDPASLDGVTLGVARSYDYTGWLNDYIARYELQPARVQAAEGEFPLRQNLRKLIDGRIDVMAGDEGVIRYIALQEGLLDEVRGAGHDPEGAWCYIAFTPADDRGICYAELLTEGIRRLRENGELDTILARYGLQDWAPDGETGEQTK